MVMLYICVNSSYTAEEHEELQQKMGVAQRQYENQEKELLQLR